MVVSQTHQQADEFITILVMTPLQMVGQEAVGVVDEVEVEAVVVVWMLLLAMQ
jgi:hypothetical protein